MVFKTPGIRQQRTGILEKWETNRLVVRLPPACCLKKLPGLSRDRRKPGEAWGISLSSGNRYERVGRPGSQSAQVKGRELRREGALELFPGLFTSRFLSTDQHMWENYPGLGKTRLKELGEQYLNTRYRKSLEPARNSSCSPVSGRKAP